VGITTDVERHDIDELEDICVRQTCKDEVGHANLKFDDDILYAEY